MKKTVLYILAISLISISLTNCKSSKKGCGLTSDAQKIEQSSTVETVLIAKTK
jgi:predicted small secreted protein